MSVLIISPAGSGSKGDEAMMRGALNLLVGESVCILNPQQRSWTEELTDLAGTFTELPYTPEYLSEEFCQGSVLFVVGADVIDGSVGLDNSLLVLDALQVAHESNRLAVTFFSFRSDPAPEIIAKIKSLESSPHLYFFPRDHDSAARFKERFPAAHSTFFPDLAFYCPSLPLEQFKANELVQNFHPEISPFVAINFSEQSFRASRLAPTDANRHLYIRSIIVPLLRAYPHHKVRLFISDTRGWANFPSDYQYALMAKTIISEDFPGKVVETINPFVRFSENIELLRDAALLITGRMHLSIAAFRAGTVPIAATGKSLSENGTTPQQAGMFDKVRGMFHRCMGRRDLVVTELEELSSLLPLSDSLSAELKAAIALHSERNRRDEQLAAQQLQALLLQHLSTGSPAPRPPVDIIATLRKAKIQHEIKIALLEQELFHKSTWANHLNQETTAKDKRINELQLEVAKIGPWGQSLEKETKQLGVQLANAQSALRDAQVRQARIAHRLRYLPSFISRRFLR